MKWELKAFVAQIVKLKVANENHDTFIKNLDGYFRRKGINLDNALIYEIYRVADEI